MSKKGILELLAERPVVGDGSYIFTLEKRGYGLCVPGSSECVLEYPQAVSHLHADYLRAGSDVLQAFTFYATAAKLKSWEHTKDYTVDQINQAACDLVRPVATSGGALICGGLSPSATYDEGRGNKEDVREQFRQQCQTFIKNKVDFLLAEFFGHVEEAELAIEECKKTGLPLAATLRMGPMGDLHGVSPGDCAVRLAKAGADIVGLNCQYDVNTFLKTLRLMKDALKSSALQPFLMAQPLGWMAPETENHRDGHHVLPEYPYALEPRLLTRTEVRLFVRQAYNLGVRYFGGCCGFEPYHIRAIAEELAQERGFRPPGQDKNEPWGESLRRSMFAASRAKIGKDYWCSLKPASGRGDDTADLSYLDKL